MRRWKDVDLLGVQAVSTNGSTVLCRGTHWGDLCPTDNRGARGWGGGGRVSECVRKKEREREFIGMKISG